jgi:DNA polymerase III delta prime subunit
VTAATKAEAPKLILPAEKTPPSLSPETAKVLLYGPPGIGKTTLAAGLNPDTTLILACEPGTGGIEAFVQRITSWEELRLVGGELAKGDHPFKTIVIDTTDEAFRFCQEYVTAKHRIKHPSDLDFGKGWSLLSDEFRLRMGKLAGLGLGVIFVSHAKDVEIEQRVGKTTKFVPTLSGQAGKFLTGFVDFIFYMAKQGTEDGEQLVLRTASSENWDAKSRVALPDPLVLPFDPQDTSKAAGVLRKAFADSAKGGA